MGNHDYVVLDYVMLIHLTVPKVFSQRLEFSEALDSRALYLLMLGLWLLLQCFWFEHMLTDVGVIFIT